MHRYTKPREEKKPAQQKKIKAEQHQLAHKTIQILLAPFGIQAEVKQAEKKVSTTIWTISEQNISMK